jgi:hypothetical protein
MQPDMGGLWRMEMLRKLREAELARQLARREGRRLRRRRGGPRDVPPSAGGVNREIDLTDDEESAQPAGEGSPVSPSTSPATRKARLAAGTPA